MSLEDKRLKWIAAMKEVCTAAGAIESGLRHKVSKKLMRPRIIDLRVALDRFQIAEKDYFGK